jgi:hypothetical protein
MKAEIALKGPIVVSVSGSYGPRELLQLALDQDLIVGEIILLDIEDKGIEFPLDPPLADHGDGR